MKTILFFFVVLLLASSQLFAETKTNPSPLAPTYTQQQLNDLAMQLDVDDYRVREAAQKKLIQYAKDAPAKAHQNKTTNQPTTKPYANFADAYQQYQTLYFKPLQNALDNAYKKTKSAEVHMRSKIIRQAMVTDISYQTLLTLCTPKLPKVKVTDSRPIFKVSTVDQLLKAIGPDRIIQLKAGRYDLNKAIIKKGKYIQWHGNKANQDLELTLQGLKNLTITGDPKKKTSILTPYLLANVLTLDNCQNVELKHLTLGHAIDKGICSGGVLYLNNCKKTTIKQCDFFGCGTWGIEISKSQNTRLVETILRDCTTGIMQISQSENVTALRCLFKRNGQYQGIQIAQSKNIHIDSCLFLENQVQRGLMLNHNSPSPKVENSIFLNNASGIERLQAIDQKNNITVGEGKINPTLIFK